MKKLTNRIKAKMLWSIFGIILGKYFFHLFLMFWVKKKIFFKEKKRDNLEEFRILQKSVEYSILQKRVVKNMLFFR